MDNYDELKNGFKENMSILINENKLDEAKDFLRQYENIVKDDIEVYSIKAVIAMMEGKMEEAEKFLIQGLEVQPFNFDILYNLAYLYECNEKFITSYRYYSKALKVSEKKYMNSIENKIKELKNMDIVKKYISRKKVLFIAHIFPPVGGSGVQRSLKFVKYLRNFGWEPIVITVDNTMYPLKDETMVSEIPEEIEVIRISEKVDINLSYANQLIQIYRGVINNKDLIEQYVKELNKSQDNINQLLYLPDPYILWATEVLDKIHDKVDFKEIDIIYTTSGPYSDHIIGYYLKQKYNKPWVVDFRDEWTNNPMAIYDKKSIRYKMDFSLEKNVVYYADKIITTTEFASENYVKNFKLDAKKVITLTNGYDESDFKDIPIHSIFSNRKFTIVHNGVLYGNRNPIIVITAIKNLIRKKQVDENKIITYFTYTDNDEEYIKYVESIGLNKNIKFIGYLNHMKSLVKANQADLLLLIIGKEEKWKSVHAGKIFEYLRLCKPILSLSPKNSVTDNLIETLKRGKNLTFDDIREIEHYILKMYKRWEKGALDQFEITEHITKYERKNLTEQLGQVFLSVVDNYKQQELIEIDLNDCDLKEKNGRFYDDIFKTGGWNETYFKHYSETHYYKIWLKALEFINKMDNPKIIDIGCGPGQFANLLFDNGIKNYKGIDFSEEAIKCAKVRNSKNKDLFMVDNAYTTNIFNENYNLVVLFEILEHVDKDLNVLGKIRENSNVLFSVPNFYSDGHVRWFNSKQEIIERYKKCVNFESIKSFSVGGLNKIFLIKGKIKDYNANYDNYNVLHD